MLLFFLIFSVNAHGHDGRRPDPSKTCYSGVRIKSCLQNASLGLCGETVPVCRRDNCPSCLPNSFLNTLCKKRIEKVCNATEIPKLVRTESVCPSCIKEDLNIPGCGDFSVSRLKECQNSLQNNDTANVCAEGERPRGKDCCLTCVPVHLTQNCSKEALSMCKRKFKDKPDCTDGESPVITSDCCRSCQIKKDTDNTRPDGGKGKCAFNKFREALQKVPECAINEVSVTDENNTRCAPSCRRTESHYAIKDIINCIKKRPECTPEGDKVRILPGDLCHRCVKPRPKCPQSCEELSVCIGEDFNVTRCERRKAFTLKMRIKNLVLLAKMRDLTKEEVVPVLLEFVERFCERNSQAVVCENNLGPLRDSLRCVKKMRNGTEERELLVDLEASARGKMRQSGQRLLLEDYTPQDLLQNAVEDNTDDVDSAAISTESTTPTETPKDKSASFRISVSALVVALASTMVFQ